MAAGPIPALYSSVGGAVSLLEQALCDQLRLEPHSLGNPRFELRNHLYPGHVQPSLVLNDRWQP